MTWKDIIKEDEIVYAKDGKKRQKTLDEFAKKIEPMIEKILNYHVSDKSDYNDKTRDKLKTTLNSAFNFNRIHVDYVSEDSAYYIDISEGEEQEGEAVTYKFDENGRFERMWLIWHGKIILKRENYTLGVV